MTRSSRLPVLPVAPHQNDVSCTVNELRRRSVLPPASPAWRYASLPTPGAGVMRRSRSGPAGSAHTTSSASSRSPVTKRQRRHRCKNGHVRSRAHALPYRMRCPSSSAHPQGDRGRTFQNLRALPRVVVVEPPRTRGGLLAQESASSDRRSIERVGEGERAQFHRAQHGRGWRPPTRSHAPTERLSSATASGCAHGSSGSTVAARLANRCLESVVDRAVGRRASRASRLPAPEPSLTNQVDSPGMPVKLGTIVSPSSATNCR